VDGVRPNLFTAYVEKRHYTAPVKRQGQMPILLSSIPSHIKCPPSAMRLPAAILAGHFMVLSFRLECQVAEASTVFCNPIQ